MKKAIPYLVIVFISATSSIGLADDTRKREYCNDMASTVSYEYRQDFIKSCITSSQASQKLINGR